MFRNLYADTRSILSSRIFGLAMLAVFAGQTFDFVITKVIYLVIDASISAESIAYFYPSAAGFIVTAATLFITDREFSNGCIRNKIISGVKRSDAFLSAVCGGMLQAVMYTLFACVVSIFFSSFFTLGFMAESISEIADRWLVTTMACVAIGVFSTSIVMMLGGNKISYVVGLFLAFAMKVWDNRILGKLYPEKGHCTLTGMNLAVCRFIDRYVPYSYLVARPHYDMGSYIIGCSAMVIFSVVIGLVVFNKRELK
ncbi:MAG: hypothetical protein J5802_10785 [Butyrivibrio sp.]|nr:hypothetical protein [Butyrivibrio sp.]